CRSRGSPRSIPGSPRRREVRPSRAPVLPWSPPGPGISRCPVAADPRLADERWWRRAWRRIRTGMKRLLLGERWACVLSKWAAGWGPACGVLGRRENQVAAQLVAPVEGADHQLTDVGPYAFVAPAAQRPHAFIQVDRHQGIGHLFDESLVEG